MSRRAVMYGTVHYFDELLQEEFLQFHTKARTAGGHTRCERQRYLL